MATNRDGWWLAAVISPLILLGVWMLWPDSREPAPVWPASDEQPADAQQTIASQWEQPQEQDAPAEGLEPVASNTDDAPEPTQPDINLDRLQHALATIGIDEDGNLVLDEVALASLRQAFRGLEGASPETLEALQQYVQAGLAGETGAQAAQVLGDYANYRSALADAEAQWADRDDLSPRQKLERTIELRRQHMDPLTASQLFAGEDAHQRYLIAMEQARTNTDLTEEERQQAQDRVREDLRSGALLVNSEGTDAVENLRQHRQDWQELGLSDQTRSYLEQQTLGLVAARDLAESDPGDWQNRYDRFHREREAILRAGLAEDEKERQVDALMDTHFTPEEVDAARNWLPDHLSGERSGESGSSR